MPLVPVPSSSVKPSQIVPPYIAIHRAMLLSQSSSDIQPFHGYVDTTEDALRLIEVRIRFQRRIW